VLYSADVPLSSPLSSFIILFSIICLILTYGGFPFTNLNKNVKTPNTKDLKFTTIGSLGYPPKPVEKIGATKRRTK
jgi:hypothetical protein